MILPIEAKILLALFCIGASIAAWYAFNGVGYLRSQTKPGNHDYFSVIALCTILYIMLAFAVALIGILGLAIFNIPVMVKIYF